MKPILPWLFALLPLGTGVYMAVKHLHWRVGFGIEDGKDMERVDFWGALLIGVIVTGFMTAIFAALGSGLAGYIGDHSAKIWRRRGAWPMVSLRSADAGQGKISGSIFMLSGFSDSRQIYYYYTINSDGSFSPGRWYPDRYTYIFEEDRADGEVVEFNVKFKHPWLEWFAAEDDDIKKEFHIPNGSLKKIFDLR